MPPVTGGTLPPSCAGPRILLTRVTPPRLPRPFQLITVRGAERDAPSMRDFHRRMGPLHDANGCLPQSILWRVGVI